MEQWGLDESMNFTPTTDCHRAPQGSYDGGWEGEDDHHVRNKQRTSKVCPGTKGARCV